MYAYAIREHKMLLRASIVVYNFAVVELNGKFTADNIYDISDFSVKDTGALLQSALPLQGIVVDRMHNLITHTKLYAVDGYAFLVGV